MEMCEERERVRHRHLTNTTTLHVLPVVARGGPVVKRLVDQRVHVNDGPLVAHVRHESPSQLLDYVHGLASEARKMLVA